MAKSIKLFRAKPRRKEPTDADEIDVLQIDGKYVIPYPINTQKKGKNKLLIALVEVGETYFHEKFKITKKF